MYVRVTRQRVKPEQRQVYLKAWAEQSEAMQTDEPGAVNYFFMQDNSDENNFIFVVMFKDRAAQQAHLQTPHFRKCKEILKANGIEPENLTIWEATNIVPDDQAVWQAKLKQ